MSATFKQHLVELLLTDSRFKDEQGELQGNVIKDCVNKLDETLIGALLNDEQTREKFFLKVKDVYVFKANDFKFYLEENSIDNSFTQYANRIGLTLNGKYLKDNTDVVLDFPYKDCILEGGQSTEEGMDAYFEYDAHAEDYVEKQSKRKEIFYNTILAKDEIDRLLEPKAFANIKKYDKEGESIPASFTRDKEINRARNLPEDTITDNLLIKGNNLLALHTLEREFNNKVKLIYIDPPYNTGSDGFNYNDNFNHSSWLTFMRNRLEIANKLLCNDGVILVQCDHHEFGYLNVLLDDVFGADNKIQQIAVKVASASGFKAVNPGPIDVLENILFYAKNKSAINFKRNYVVASYHKNYNRYLDNSNKDINKWKLIPLKTRVLEYNNFKSENEAKKQFGEGYPYAIQRMIEDFAFSNANNVVSVRDLHKPTQQVKELQDKSRIERDKFFVYTKQDGENSYIINGGALAFYSTKIREIDGKDEVTELLTNFWEHISWAGIAREGGVSLKNGKKPEKLLKQILELNSEDNDIVLDYHLGSGTTCAVAHKMNRKYIGIEQLDYDDNDASVRLKNVIEGDKTGVSTALNWQGGGSFVYMELAKNNQKAKEQINKCKNYKELIKLFDTLYSKYFLHYNVRINEFKNTISKEENFKKLSLERQKEIFCRMLDNNQLYVHAGEMEDKQYGLSKDDMRLTKDFYQQ